MQRLEPGKHDSWSRMISNRFHIAQSGVLTAGASDMGQKHYIFGLSTNITPKRETREMTLQASMIALNDLYLLTTRMFLCTHVS